MIGTSSGYALIYFFYGMDNSEWNFMIWLRVFFLHRHKYRLSCKLIFLVVQ